MRTTPRRRVGLAAAVAALVALSLSGCFGTAKAPVSNTSTPTGEATSAELAPFYTQKLVWTDCEDDMQCTTAKAPLDYRDPAAADVELALIRHPATGQKIGSLLVNPGGPGGSGYDFVRDSLDYAVDKKLQEHFDVVGFDPRGVNKSTPVACYQPAQMDQYLYSIAPGDIGSDPWIAAQQASAQSFAQACNANTGVLLDNIDTVSAARDMDLLRAVLGDKKLSYLGYSYGTALGANYAGLFPEKVGRMVLDGALDPTSDNFEVTKEQAKGFESALRAYLTDCLGDSKTCPFTGSVDDSMGTVRALLDSVQAQPIRATDGRELGSSALLTAIIYPLYSQEGWPALSQMFDSVMAGEADTAFYFADEYNGRNKDGSYRDNSTEAFLGVNCMDYSYNADPATMRAQADELEKAAPTIGLYMSYGDITCANWPYTTRADREPIHAKGSPPIVVVGTTNDPATPYVWAKALADQLDKGVLVTYHGEGHTAYNKSNSCVNDAVDTYLLTGKAPSSDPKC
ncbi:alpha/beta hydrolase [Rathayibacter sp. YIM 133350]|uniref:alpha/beta hydrolase n=1 Tax=Rathayibacter sp. YIM 133350 TaxID=3131992 RepID=UPI00307EAD7F